MKKYRKFVPAFLVIGLIIFAVAYNLGASAQARNDDIIRRMEVERWVFKLKDTCPIDYPFEVENRCYTDQFTAQTIGTSTY